MKSRAEKILKNRKVKRLAKVLAGVALVATVASDTTKDLPIRNSVELLKENIISLNRNEKEQYRTGKQDYEFNKGQQRRLKCILGDVCKSDEGTAMFDAASKAGFVVCFDNSLPDNVNGTAYFTTKVIALNPRTADDRLVITASHEMAHARQVGLGVMKKSNLSLEEAFLLRRHWEADAVARSVKTAWELKEKGFDKPWNTFKSYKDVAKIYEKAIGEYGDENLALKATYDAWFKKQSRVDCYDNSSSRSIECSLEKVFSSFDDSLYCGCDKLIDYVHKMGQNPDGSNYLAKFNEKELKSGKYSGKISEENKKQLAKFHLRFKILKKVNTNPFEKPTAEKPFKPYNIAMLEKRKRVM